MSVVVYTIQTKRPWLAAERFLAHLHTTASGASWAIVDRLGRRFKVGATAFLTVEAAEKRREGLCAKTLAPRTRGYLEYAGQQGVIDACLQQQPRPVYRWQKHA